MERVNYLVAPTMKRFEEFSILDEFDIPEEHKLMAERIEEFIKRGGKRLRPTIVTSTIKTYDPDRVSEAWWAEVSLEFDHNYFLIHDDIEDGSFTRRGGPTMHILYGVDKAINYGDYLSSLAGRALDKGLDLWGRKTYSRLTAARHEMLKRTGEGQDYEFELRTLPMEGNLTEEATLEILRKKTAFYTIFTPYRYGAIIAGLPDEEIFELKEAWINVGISFQITDDILDLIAYPQSGKDWAGDLEEIKRTYLLATTYDRADSNDRKRFLEVLDIDGEMVELVKKRDDLLIKGVSEDNSIYKEIQKEIDDLKHEIIEIMDKYNVIKSSKEKACYFAEQAMPVLREKLPESDGKEELLDLVRVVYLREY